MLQLEVEIDDFGGGKPNVTLMRLEDFDSRSMLPLMQASQGTDRLGAWGVCLFDAMHSKLYVDSLSTTQPMREEMHSFLGCSKAVRLASEWLCDFDLQQHLTAWLGA